MSSVPHALHAWWLYSQLTFFPFGSTAILVVYGWVSALVGRDLVQFVCAAGLTVMWLAYLAWGAVNAQRARRLHGCW